MTKKDILLSRLASNRKLVDNTTDDIIRLDRDGVKHVLLDTAVAMGILKDNLNDDDFNIVVDWIMDLVNDSALSGSWGGGPAIAKDTLLAATDPDTAVLNGITG